MVYILLLHSFQWTFFTKCKRKTSEVTTEHEVTMMLCHSLHTLGSAANYGGTEEIYRLSQHDASIIFNLYIGELELCLLKSNKKCRLHQGRCTNADLQLLN